MGSLRLSIKLLGTLTLSAILITHSPGAFSMKNEPLDWKSLEFTCKKEKTLQSTPRLTHGSRRRVHSKNEGARQMTPK